ncbi:TPA: hypothetical protein ACHWKL_004143 [Providencia stuartii]|uniref:Gp7 n=1 Tax=Providencia stuartii TaxID=588 RepID=A0AAJ1NCN7_PROST|nr:MULTISPECIES: hypothetical protein [Providencia]APG52665.1 hypothetical protein BGK56_17655 [Providencia stuartii]EMA3643433.1 hypothetical protein [Providencia stuartii]MBW3102769.1 hypothetical protein [Providencia stuartii]MCB5219547.1 hypothetical protein [Providencia stuartii]MDE5305514.1 hypothetical protein [Providencia stuartii]
MPIQVNVTTKVNSASIRRETYNGREHIIIPSYTLPANVIMNGGLYPSTEIDAHYRGLEGTLAPLGHPTVNGEFVSALSAEGINQGHIGAWNRNVEKVGNRIYVEKWIDVNKAKESEGGREVLARVEALESGESSEPIHTSVAVFLEKLEANEEQKAQGYNWIAKIHRMDHDAILLHESGAATPTQGVGMMVNADQATEMQINNGALTGETYREKEHKLTMAARKQFATGGEFVWVSDFTDTHAVIIVDNGTAKLHSYTNEDGVITFDTQGEEVERQESWVKVVTNKLKSVFSKPQASPAINNSTEGDMPLTQEEKKELVGDIAQALAANLAEQLKPINEKVDALQVNHKKLEESLTANQRAEEAEMRKEVAAKYGEVVANSLQGQALIDMHKQLGEAASLAGNSVAQQEQVGAPNPAEYFKGAQ